MKLYGGYIDFTNSHFEIVSMNCTEEGEKLFIELSDNWLSNLFYQFIYPAGYILKSQLNTILDANYLKGDVDENNNIKIVYSFDKDYVFNIVDFEREHALEIARCKVEELEKPIIIHED